MKLGMSYVSVVFLLIMTIIMRYEIIGNFSFYMLLSTMSPFTCYRGVRVLREGYGGESTGWLDLGGLGHFFLLVDHFKGKLQVN